MPIEAQTWNRAVVFGAGVLYWSSVFVQARRIRRHIGRSPNVRPRGFKEKLLWVGWFAVVGLWLALPWLGGDGTSLPWTKTIASPVPLLFLALGAGLMAAGYVLTLWCYVAMGDRWRMGINRAEETQLVTNGPYGFVRHPIYLGQIVMVTAIVVLLPSLLSLVTLAIHLLCVVVKVADEEAHLRVRLGQAYEQYCAQAGWFPGWRARKPSCHPAPAIDRDTFKTVEPPLR